MADDEADPLISLLRLSGIVRSERGWLAKRNGIYNRVFDRKWVQANLPGAELRRQRAAVRLGVLRTAGIALVVVIVILVMWLFALRETKNAYFAQAKAALLTGYRGQRHLSLSAIANARGLLSDESNLRNLVVKSLTLMDLAEGASWPGWPTSTLCFALSPDFRSYAQGDSQGTVTVRNSTDGNELARLPGSGLPAQLLVFSPNNQYLAVTHEGGGTAEVVVFDWLKRKEVLRKPDRINGRALEFSPDSHQLACGQPSGLMLIYSLASANSKIGPVLTLTNAMNRPANCIRFHPTAHQLAESSGSSLYVQIWDLDTGQLRPPLFHRGAVFDLAWHPDGELLAAACQSGEIYLWDLSLPVTHRVLGKQDGAIRQVAFNHEGGLLASAGVDKTVRLWSPFTGRQMTQQLESEEELESLLFSSDDEHLGLRRMGQEVRLWDVNPAREYRVLFGHVGPSAQIETVDFSPDGRWLAAASEAGIVVWDAASGKTMLNRDESTTHAAFFDPGSGDLLASSSLYGWHRFRFEAHPPASRFLLNDAGSLATNLPVELGPFALARKNGKTAAVLHSTNEICIFDPSKPGGPTVTLIVTNRYQYLALDPGGRYLAARIAPEAEISAQTSPIHIYDLTKQARVTSTPPFDAGPYFAFSPEGEWFVSTSLHNIKFWQVGTWRGDREFKFNGPIAFSKDERLVAMADGQSAIELVGLPEGTTLVRLENPDRKRVRGLAFSNDGRRLAAISSEQLVLLWDLALITRRLSALKLKGKLPLYQ